MPPLPHGGGMAGASHSHDPQFPDDDWNLYSMLDPSTTSLNVTSPEDTLGVFKPHARRLESQPELISDADDEIIVMARFTAPVHLRKIMVIGSGGTGHHPSRLRCYVNQDNIDFTNVGALRPAQEFNLPVNENGTVELFTAIHPFTNISSVTFYFSGNHGDEESTSIQYIGMQGDHTHYRREAVDTVYEVLCNGQDIVQPEDADAVAEKHLH